MKKEIFPIGSIIVLVLFQCISGQIKARLKPVTTHLNAKWPQTPYILEAAEYLAEENAGTFWSFVEVVNNNIDSGTFENKNLKERYDEILVLASQFLSVSQINLLKFSLALRVYSPKVEAYRQIALDKNVPTTANCLISVDINGVFVCDINAIHEAVKKADNIPSDVFEIDHSFPGGENSKIVAILYGELGAKNFKYFHNTLKKYAEDGKVNYILRPFKRVTNTEKVRLSGYGVELQIKSTEYKAQDDTKVQEETNAESTEQEVEQEINGFIFSKLKTLYPDDIDSLNELKIHLIESSHEMAPLKVWQLQHLSMQAAQRIMESPPSEMLNVFANTALNFPSLARSLIRTKVDDKLKREIVKNQNYLRSAIDINPTDAALFINGIFFDLDYTDIYTLLDNIKNEHRVMNGLFKLGINGDTLNKLLEIDISESKQEYGIDIRDSSIVWMNDIENDKEYRRWPSSVGELLRPAFPGMMRSIRKNFHNLVIIADPSERNAVSVIRLMDGFLAHSTPIRFGLIMAVNANKKLSGLDDPGIALLCAFNYVVQLHDEREDANRKGLQFLTEFYSNIDEKDINEITVKLVISFFMKRYPAEDKEDIFGIDSDYDVGRQLANIFVEKGGFKTTPLVLMNGVPLPEKILSENEFEEAVLLEVMRNTQFLQHAVYKGHLDEARDVVDWLMSQPNIMLRLNDRILTTKQSKFLDMSGKSIEKLPSLNEFVQLNAPEMTSAIASSCHYISTKIETAVRPLTIWVVGDFESSEGREFLVNAVKYTRESNGVRVCALHNSAQPGQLSRAIHVAQSTLPSPIARQFLLKILDDDNVKKISAGEKKITEFGGTGFDAAAFDSRMKAFNDDIFKIHNTYAIKVLNLPMGHNTIVANGRMLGVFSSTETFTDEDFSLLENFFLSSFGEKIKTQLNDVPIEQSSDLIMKASGVIQIKSQSKARTSISLKSEQYSVIDLPPRDASQPAFDIMAICDPVSKAAQKIAPILQTLQDVLNARIRIVLNAVEKHSEMPLKSYYRFVVQSEPQFAESENSIIGPSARFIGLHESSILTQNYHVSDNWLVEVVKSIHDLDNIKLEQVESGIHSEFELEHLLLEGHCFEQSTGNPPRGLQFTLGTQQQPVLVDTIVMANLGYFQLKANPGAMILRLREGRSSEIYDIFSHEGTDTPRDSKDVKVVISNFRSQVVKVRVAKKPNMQNVDLLVDEEEDAGGLWGSITSTFGSSSNSYLDDDEDEKVINIFSVASGHLYERFLRIMMASVTKHTSLPVKFWFLKNFLSPSLKDSLPLLAEELGFQYELVQYKWPRWLHQQTEKQRIIWGYKILFLDVLFPLGVKKIIFVDADQVVRADLKELAELDLEGAPYGFVPFCDSRKEMEGFRFWKQGYWRNHLAGRKYHISALFVVDLKKFRRVAAGDRLRGQYQGLSQDPNSLSNLDQDLPNNMVHQVKIKSLPMEWLWCETWCDDYSKQYAKVIDLCNNPLTKEAKLDAANRIISEWSDYDVLIKDVLQKNKSDNNDRSADKGTPDNSDIPSHTEL